MNPPAHLYQNGIYPARFFIFFFFFFSRANGLPIQQSWDMGSAPCSGVSVCVTFCVSSGQLLTALIGGGYEFGRGEWVGSARVNWYIPDTTEK